MRKKERHFRFGGKNSYSQLKANIINYNFN